jgi:hypothetical protein
VLTLVLVTADEAQGGAIAAAVAESLLAVGLLIALLRAHVTRIGVPALLIVVLAGLAGAAPLLVAGVHPLIRTLAGVVIYVAVLAVCKRIPPEIRHVFQRGAAEPAATT